MRRKTICFFIAVTLMATVITGCSKQTLPEEPDNSSTEKSASEESALEGSSVGDQESDDTSKSEDCITIITHNVISELDGKKAARGKYTEIVLPDSYASQHPKLKVAIDKIVEGWGKSVDDDVSSLAYYKSDEGDNNPDLIYESDYVAEVVRADDKLFSILLSSYYDGGGVHPFHSVSSINLDPATGNYVSLFDVLADTDNAPQYILDTLHETYPELKEEIDSFSVFDDNLNILDILTEKLYSDEYTWQIDSKGLNITFSPYEIASYAAGYIDIVLENSKYPGLINPPFITSKDLDPEKMIAREDGDTKTVEAAISEAESDGYVIENKSWNSFNDNVQAKENPEYIKLTKTKEEKTEWLDTEVWANEHGFDLAYPDHSDDKYYYTPYNSIQYSYMYNSLDVYAQPGMEHILGLDLYTLCNGPDEEQGKVSNDIQYLNYATLQDGILYLSLIHNGYAEVEPLSNYMVAVDEKSKKVLWRSEPLVSNAKNFCIIKDTIVCGYGFTDEEDFIYLLDRYTGKQIDKIKVNTGPDQFEVVGDTLYVATYNTAYEFKIEDR